MLLDIDIISTYRMSINIGRMIESQGSHTSLIEILSFLFFFLGEKL